MLTGPKQLFISSGLLERYGFTGIFSLRHGGVSKAPFDSLNLGPDVGDRKAHVQKNLSILLKAAGVPVPHQARQVHGADYLQCRGKGCLHQEDADILLGEIPGCAVGVRTADCLPILLANIESGMIAAVHAGWRGTAQGVVSRAANILLRLGAKPGNLVASLGPCIGSCCFNVDEGTASQLAASCPGAEKHIHADNTFRVDLAAINRLQLIQSGLPSSHIEHLDACTCCRESDFFSHRRDRGKTGRHLAIVATHQGF